MSSERGEHYLESVYLFGTPDEVVASLQARVDAGVEYFMLHTMTPDPAQLRHWVDEIIPSVRFPSTAGPVRRLRVRCAVTSGVALLGQPLRRATRRSCTTPPSPRPGSTRGMSCSSWSPTTSRARSPRRAARTGSGSG